MNNNSTPSFVESDLMIVPIERSETIPSRLYTEPRYHDFDKQHLFPETWQYVGHVSRVQNHGDYLAGTVADNPVIIVRGKDNLLRAFFNVCRHRGGPLAIDDHGSCNALQCKYHGWTYLLDGSLRGVPQFDRVELFDRKDYGLIPVQLEIWDGLIFVNLSKRKANSPTLQSVVNGISERIAPRRLADTKFFRRINYEVRCNWKVYVDNYLEGYHLPYVHPELCTLLDYQNYITEIFEYYSLQHSPLTGTDTLYGKDGGAALYYFIFPNFMLNILPGRLQTNLVVPLSHNTTRVIFDYYYDDITSPHARKMAEEDIKYSDHVQHEDMQICEHVQQGLESMAYDKGRFSVEMERGVYHFQCLLKKAYRAIMDR